MCKKMIGHTLLLALTLVLSVWFSSTTYAVSEIRVKNNLRETVFIQLMRDRPEEYTETLIPKQERRYVSKTKKGWTGYSIRVLNRDNQPLCIRSILPNEASFVIEEKGNEKTIHCADLEETLTQLEQMPVELQSEILNKLLRPIQRQLQEYMLVHEKINNIEVVVNGRTALASLSPDRSVLATVCVNSNWIKLYDLKQNSHELASLFVDPGTQNIINSIAFHPTQNLLASGTTSVQIWDIQTAKVIQTLRNSLFTGNPMKQLTYSPDGKKLAAITGYRHITVWDVQTGESKTLSAHTDNIHSISFSPDGTLLVSGAKDGSIKVWNVRIGREIQSFSEERKEALAVVITPDNKKLVSFVTNGLPLSSQGKILLQIRNIPTGEIILTKEYPSTEIQFPPDSITYINNETFAVSTLNKFFICLGNNQHLKLFPVIFPYYRTDPQILSCSKNSMKPDEIAIVYKIRFSQEDYDCNRIFIRKLHDDKNQSILRILQDHPEDPLDRLNSPQKFLLFVLSKKTAKSINLWKLEKELRYKYRHHKTLPPELLDLKQAYESMPPELRRMLKKYFHILK